MGADPKLIAAVFEAAVPLIGGTILTMRSLKMRAEGAPSGKLWIGPLLVLFGVLLLIKPFTATEPQTAMNQTSTEPAVSRDVASLTYDDFLGSWEAVVDGKAIRRRLTFRFTFKPGGDCVLDYVSFNLDTSGEVKHFYDMQCEVADGKLTHMAKDPSQGEQYEESHTIDSFDGGSFVWSDKFVGPIRYRKQGS